MTDKIIELLPSADLKAKIKATNHQFKENELLQIIYRYAPNFDARLKLLEEFAEIASTDVPALAKVYIKYQQDNYNRFIEASEGFVYELCIKENPDSYEEKYLCSSLNGALVCIERFYEEYASVNAIETDKTRYKILKRKVFSENDRFEEDTYAEMTLGEHKTILEVSDYRNPADCDLNTMCSECKEFCPRRIDDVAYPCFACNYAIIKYRNHEGKDSFGVNLCMSNKCDGLESELYVIPLDSHTIREHRFEDDFYDHQHIELPLATLATTKDLDETMRKNYFDFIEYLKANGR